MSTRSDLRVTIHAAIKEAFDRPRFAAADKLADLLTVLFRQGQHDAWIRGFAAGKMDEFAQAHGKTGRHVSPYNGGRHLGTVKAWQPEEGALVQRVGPLATIINYFPGKNGRWTPKMWDGEKWVKIPETWVNNRPGSTQAGDGPTRTVVHPKNDSKDQS